MKRGELGLVAVFLMATACSSITEDHYFGKFDARTAEPVNFFRVRVRGSANLSSARYIAGFNDERAVDLFFSTLKSSKSLDERMLFVEGQKEPGTETVIKPLSPDAEHGAFLLILSTDAKAVTDTIGNFAESQIVADSLTNLLNRDRIEDAQSTVADVDARLALTNALRSELDALFEQLAQATTPAAREALLLRILTALASHLEGPVGFVTLDEAVAWFRTHGAPRRRG